MAEPSLTIAIPTFNRPRQLRETLTRLRSQMSDRCRVVILDNHSDVASSGVLQALGWTADSRIECRRNPANIGQGGNLARCFEVAETPWMAILGDDDQIAPDYVAALLDAIDRHPEAVFINFASTLHRRPNDFVCHGLADFVHRFDHWPNVLFISAGLYHRERVAPFIRFGYQYAYTLAPYLAILLKTLAETNGLTIFLSRVIVTYQEAETLTWPRLLLSNSTLLIELLPGQTLQEVYLRKIKRYFLPLHTVAELLIAEALRSGHEQTFAFRWRALLHDGPTGSPLRATRNVLLGFLVAHPHFGHAVVRLTKAFLGKQLFTTPATESTAAI